VEPFLTRAFYGYTAGHLDVVVDYNAVGTANGIDALKRGAVDFAATDTPLTASDLAAFGGHNAVVQVPNVVGAIAIAFRLDGITPLQLDGPALGDIYLGRLTRWRDPRLVALNPGMELPDLPIKVVHRGEANGTNYLFTDYLSHVHRDWAARYGAQRMPDWPVGIGASRTEGMVRAIAADNGSIGYVDWTYVNGTAVAAALIRNRSGAFVRPGISGAGAAATVAGAGVSSESFSLADQPGEAVYPIAVFQWLIARRGGDAASAALKADVFGWIVTKGQRYAAAVDYAPLPPVVQAAAAARSREIVLPAS
jgi:phosphate transport system substrate-binding protein